MMMVFEVVLVVTESWLMMEPKAASANLQASEAVTTTTDTIVRFQLSFGKNSWMQDDYVVTEHDNIERSVRTVAKEVVYKSRSFDVE